MKYKYIGRYLLLAGILFSSILADAQLSTLKLATGDQELVSAGSEAVLSQIKQTALFEGKYFWIARFSSNPTIIEKKSWANEGFTIHEHLGPQTYLVSSAAAPSLAFNSLHHVGQVASLDPALKISPALQQGKFARFKPDVAGRIPLLVAVVPGVSISLVKEALAAAGFAVDPNGPSSIHIISLLTPPGKIEQLASFPFIEFIQPAASDRVLNEKARFMSGAFKLNASIANGGYNLNGSGVVVGVGDDADPSLHPDLADRIINRTPGIVNSHGAHVSGTIAGGGILQPDRRGLAPLATIVSQFFSGIWLNAAQYVQDFGMVLTNNSYGAVEGDCDYNGVYDLNSQLLDEQAFFFPQLLHVFAAGNSGDDICSPLPVHYNTILGGYQPAKNVITVGRTDYNQLASGSSSSGPVRDGRLKPEITSLGIVESTDAGSGYFGAYGTSQSAPSVTGGLALLYERYRQIFSGNNPDGALMKCILLNGARDIGTPGPDYRHGYGFIHLENSIRILNNHQYFGGKLAQGGTKDSVISVPAGTAILKVMLYWHDPAASPLVVNTLMNDLDLEVIRPDGSTIVYPKKLNPASPGTPASEGPDHTNNSEQVVIETPIAGNYTIRIKGNEVLSTPDQAYYTTFDFVPAAVTLRTPVKGDNWSISSPDEFAITGVVISWDDEGTTPGTYTLEYSLDDGSSWNLILGNLTDDNRYYGWRPPAGTATNQAKVRISKNGTAFTSTSDAFTIIGRPVYSIAANPCEGYITVNWAAVTGADDYEVIMKQGPQMVPVAVVAPPALTYTINGLSKDSTYYVAVRARKAGVAGRWIKANPTTPNSGACAGSISDGDLKLDSITSPLYGRQFTSVILGAAENVKVRIKNLDNVVVPLGQFNIKLSVDGAPFISQPGTAAIPALGTYVHTFSGIDLSTLGTHTLKAVIENTSLPDKVAANDSFTLVVKNLPNAPVFLAATLSENFDAAPAFTVQKTTNGLPGLDRWDYYNSDKYARLRSFVNSGIASSGQRAITMDVSKATPYVKNPANNLDATFNLSNYTTADDIRLDFLFKQHGVAQVPDSQNRVWVRGSDKGPWIEAYNLGANQPELAGVWKRSLSLELNDLLSAASPAQVFTSSMQVRFGQLARFGMADNEHLAGLSFDDVRMYIAVNDLQLLSIDAPAIYSCGLNNSVPVKITVRNSTGGALSNIPVSYTINGGAPVNEVIPANIPANTNFDYQFAAPANLAAVGSYTIDATVNFPGDNVPDNNKTSIVINNQPVISSFPYLENFESGNGNYFVSGLHSSWEYGKPGSILIDTAASGQNVWKTRLAGSYNDNEYSQLNSPCFNISGLADPMLSFSLAYDLEDCSQYGFVCDAAWVEYSTDGINWTKLGKKGEGVNWYDNNNNDDVWSKRKQTWWHVASYPLPKGSTSLRLRFVMASDDNTDYEGIAIDDIHIYDRSAPMYTTLGTSNAVNLPVSGTAPVNFTLNSKLVATLLPNNNNLGSTEVRAYIFDGPVRNTNLQYYGNRNITVKPSNDLNGNVTVRFYFSDKEVNAMRLANTCSGCTNPKDYTRLGVTQYTDADKANEDGDLANNTSGISNYINGSQLKMVPYDSGYYAEFSVSKFSEFWLNDGHGGNQVLAGRWLSFNAVKQGNDVVKLKWSTTNEVGISLYEIQVAGSREAFNANRFEIIGTSPAKNLSPADYTFLDQRPGKSGDFYYRIKQVDSNGKFYYSPVVLVQFGLQNFEVKMFPNPVTDNLVIAVQSPANQQMQVQVFNMTGQLLYNQKWQANTGTSQQKISFKQLGVSSGVYTIAVTDGAGWWYGKVVKQ